MKIQRKHLTIGRLLVSTANPHKDIIYQVVGFSPKGAWGGHWQTFDEYSITAISARNGAEMPRFPRRDNLTLGHISRYYALYPTANPTQPC